MESRAYPQISEASLTKVREQFVNSRPTVFTPSAAQNLLGMKDPNSAMSNVLRPMQMLGILDKENHPTEIADLWRIDGSYAEACEQMLKNTYPTELLELFPDTQIDKDRLVQWFMAQGLGKSGAEKAAKVYSLLRSQQPPSKPTAKPQAQAHKKARATSAPSPASGAVPSPTLSTPTAPTRNVTINLTITIAENADPAATQAIIESLGELLKK